MQHPENISASKFDKQKIWSILRLGIFLLFTIIHMKKTLLTILAVNLVLGFAGSSMAATTPDLGVASRFWVLSNTFSITTSTTVNGDVGYTTLSVPLLTVVGWTIFVPASQAWTDQGVALSALNAEVCTVTFAAWAIDLSADNAPQHTGTVYTPWVYCIDGAMSIDTAPGITLSGAGTYIFRSNGALGATAAGMSVTLTGGASACDVFWTPNGATTLGANNNFVGTVIPVSQDISVGANTTWLWRALTFGHTVTTNTTTITNTCGSAAGTGTLNVIKTVVGGTGVPSDFRMYVNYNGSVVGSGLWTGGIGTVYTLTAGTYTVSEDTNASYTQSLSADCLNVTLLSGDDKTCTITNTYITPPASAGGWWVTLTRDSCPDWDYSSGYYDGMCWTAPIVVTGSVLVAHAASGATGSSDTVDEIVPEFSPKLPKTGVYAENISILLIVASILMAVSISGFLIFRKVKA